MNADLELFTAFFVNKRRAVRRIFPQLRWERNRPDDLRIRPFGRLDDRTRRLVNDLMIIGPDLDPNTLFDGLGGLLINVFYHRTFPSSAGEGHEGWLALHAPARRRIEDPAKVASLRPAGALASPQRTIQYVFSDCQPAIRNLTDFCRDP